MDSDTAHRRYRGRGAVSNRVSRFADHQRERFDDGWALDREEDSFPTTLHIDSARTIISRNDSPDVPFSRSINPYAGCQHGCAYCYARPSHAYRDLSPGLDFETEIFYKPNAAELLRAELSKSGYRPQTIALGANTDAYQPAERQLRITRELLEVLHETRHPTVIITKSNLVLRDMDLLADMARDNIAAVLVSITTLDGEIARRMEPRAVTPQRRIETIHRLTEVGIPCGVLISPIVPGLTDHEIEDILAAAAHAGARRANMIILRLPRELREIFSEWLAAHYPDRASKVLGLLRQCRSGQLNDPGFGSRMSGSGPIADMIGQRFALATRRLGLGTPSESWELTTSRFRITQHPGGQMTLPL